jgi:hypothetical protein
VIVRGPWPRLMGNQNSKTLTSDIVALCKAFRGDRTDLACQVLTALTDDIDRLHADSYTMIHDVVLPIMEPDACEAEAVGDYGTVGMRLGQRLVQLESEIESLKYKGVLIPGHVEESMRGLLGQVLCSGHADDVDVWLAQSGGFQVH